MMRDSIETRGVSTNPSSRRPGEAGPTPRKAIYIPSVRDRQVDRVRRQIRDGVYNEDAKLDACLDKVLDALKL